jgi:hypothetical protein
MHIEIGKPCFDVTQGRAEGDGAEMFAAVCKLGLEGIVSKKLKSGGNPGVEIWTVVQRAKMPANMH